MNELKTSIKTYDRDALCCGVPCWRWVYHALHSADKWFINPFDYEEPPFHEEGMDNPDKPCKGVLSDEQLLRYLDSVEKKTIEYLDTLTDEMLYEKPEKCRYTRMELVLRQFRHISLFNYRYAKWTNRSHNRRISHVGIGNREVC